MNLISHTNLHYRMHTRIRRIDELMKSDKNFSGDITESDYSRLERELEEQFGNFNDENSVLKDRIKKLEIVKKGLQGMGDGKV